MGVCGWVVVVVVGLGNVEGVVGLGVVGLGIVRLGIVVGAVCLGIVEGVVSLGIVMGVIGLGVLFEWVSEVFVLVATESMSGCLSLVG